MALDLIGRHLRVTNRDEVTLALIVETEAYGDATDAASHAAFRPGGRAAIMAGRPGSVYVYAAYGMYPCFNIVTGPTGHASAALVRGVWRAGDPGPTLGPGRVSNLLGISLEDHGEVLPGPRFGISSHRQVGKVDQTARIGISRAVDTPWRFVAVTET